jgi:hypothetical protein
MFGQQDRRLFHRLLPIRNGQGSAKQGLGMKKRNPCMLYTEFVYEPKNFSSQQKGEKGEKEREGSGSLLVHSEAGPPRPTLYA